jgi:hypothetical protein
VQQGGVNGIYLDFDYMCLGDFDFHTSCVKIKKIPPPLPLLKKLRQLTS